MQERHNSIANAMELSFSFNYTPSMCFMNHSWETTNPLKSFKVNQKEQRDRGYMEYCQRYFLDWKFIFLTVITHAKNNNSNTCDDSFIELFGINMKMVNEFALEVDCISTA